MSWTHLSFAVIWTAFLEYLFPRLLPNYIKKGGISPPSVECVCLMKKTYPDIIALLHEHEWDAPLLVRKAHPDITGHKKT